MSVPRCTPGVVALACQEAPLSFVIVLVLPKWSVK